MNFSSRAHDKNSIRPLLLAAVLLAGSACAPAALEEGAMPDTGKALAQDFMDSPIAPNARFAPGRVIVGFDEASLPEGILEGGMQLRRIRRLGGMDAALFALPSNLSVEDAVAELRASGRFAYVEPDYERTILVNDPYLSYQWDMAALGAETAWLTSTGSGVVVAVVDTGVSSGPNDGVHGLLAGYDFVNNDSNAADDQGHGTHVAGTIAQNTNNGKGVAGLAYDASILPVKVLNSAGTGYVSDIVEGIDYAVAQGADVINLSLGSSTGSTAEARAIQSAWDAGVFVAAASGNDGASTVYYPAAYSGAAAVGATGYGNYRASYSNTGTALDFVAPGGDLSQDLNGDGYGDGIIQETFSGANWSYYLYQGTSMASPHVAAAAALLMGEGASNAEAFDALSETAVDLGSTGWDSSYGHGLIAPAPALDSLQGEEADLTAPIITSVRDRLVRGIYTVTWSTDEASTSEVCPPSMTRCTGNLSSLVTAHSVSLRARARSAYYVRSIDEAGNAAVSGPYTY